MGTLGTEKFDVYYLCTLSMKLIETKKETKQAKPNARHSPRPQHSFHSHAYAESSGAVRRSCTSFLGFQFSRSSCKNLLRPQQGEGEPS